MRTVSFFNAGVFFSAVVVFLIIMQNAGYADKGGLEDNMYGFVSYGGDESPPLDDAPAVIRSLGAGWLQSEGPVTFSRGACWGLIQPENLYDFDWDTVEWVNAAAAEGLGVLMVVAPGHDSATVDNYSPWTDCGGAGPVWPTSNCPPGDYQQWYEFCYAVGEHFDGEHGAPRIDYYMTTGETDDVNYWLGSAEQYYGGSEATVVTRRNNMGQVELPAALVPVLELGIKDANPDAKIVVGACTAWRSYAWNHLKDMIDSGASEDEVTTQAKRYGLTDSFAQLVNRLENDPLVRRSVEFLWASLSMPQHYDIYGAHYYAMHGYHDAISYLLDQMEESAVNKPVWMTGEGRPFSGDAAGHLKSADLHLRRIIYSHALGLDWHDVSFLVDVVLFNCCGMYKLPQAGRDYPARRPLADTFRLMAHLFPSAGCATPQDVESPYADTELFSFSVQHPGTGYAGGAAAGWCENTCPEFSSIGMWCTEGCPKPEIDISAVLDISDGTAVTVLDAAGEIIEHNDDGYCPVVFDESPFVAVWGPDRDGDEIPDILDNCPETSNQDQTNNPAEHLEGNGNPQIPAPDWIGDACDPCPDDGHPDCGQTCDTTGVVLSMPTQWFTPGDNCFLTASVCNASTADLNGNPLFVILDVYGQYWFAPGWTETPDAYSRNYEPGLTVISVINPFQWPQNTGTAENIFFHAALTDPGITTILGEMSSWRFGWE